MPSGKAITQPEDSVKNCAEQPHVALIPLDRITTFPKQVREVFDQKELEDLAESIKEYGIIQPIIVQPIDGSDRFALIAGERRLRAARMLGLTCIPGSIREGIAPMELALIENLQRKNLNPIEEARALLNLKEQKKFTDEDLARIIGRTRENVTQILTLNRLPEVIQEECKTSYVPPKSLLYEIATMEDEAQMIQAWKRLKRGRLTVRQCREMKKNSGDTIDPNGKRHVYKGDGEDPKYRLQITFSTVHVEWEAVLSVLKNEMKKVEATIAERNAQRRNSGLRR